MQNLHLQHPEDSILMGDLSALDWFTTGGEVSVKLMVLLRLFGAQILRHRLFSWVRKQFSTKRNLRIAHSHDEIDLHYEGEVADILHACFDCLPRTDCIFPR